MWAGTHNRGDPLLLWAVLYGQGRDHAMRTVWICGFHKIGLLMTIYGARILCCKECANAEVCNESCGCLILPFCLFCQTVIKSTEKENNQEENHCSFTYGNTHSLTLNLRKSNRINCMLRISVGTHFDSGFPFLALVWTR